MVSEKTYLYIVVILLIVAMTGALFMSLRRLDKSTQGDVNKRVRRLKQKLQQRQKKKRVVVRPSYYIPDFSPGPMPHLDYGVSDYKCYNQPCGFKDESKAIDCRSMGVCDGHDCYEGDKRCYCIQYCPDGSKQYWNCGEFGDGYPLPCGMG
jgi:hypothetical protein